MIKLKTLGQCLIEIGENRVGPDAELLFPLLLYLAIERGKRVDRSALASLLWPATREERAAHSLRQSVYRLKSLGASVESNRSHIWIPRECVDADYFPFLDTAENGVAEELAEDTSGTFLPGYAPTFSPPFAEWIDRQRDIVDSAIRRVLVTAVTAKRSRGEWSAVEAIAGRILSIDPMNEEATLASAQALALHGGKVQALAMLDRYLKEIGPDAREIRLPASVLRRRIADAQHIDRANPVTDPPFTGRAEEMADLLHALELALGGQGSACVLWGEPGMGKTRLSHEFTRVAQLERVQIVRIGAQSNDERRPLSAFVDVVPKLLNLPGAIGCTPESMQYLRRLIEHKAKDTMPTPDTREAAFLYASIRRSVFDLIDAVASEKCLILIFEDVHWLDSASWEVISEAVPWLATRRVLLVMTSRVPDAERKKGIAELPTLHRRHLHPLGDVASRTLLDSLLRLRGGAVREDLAEWCAATGGGNPYYLSELALHGLRDGGGSSKGYRLPASLTTLISERISLLRPVSLRLLQACAVLGKNSTLERLETVLQQTRIDLLDALEELENHGLITSDCARVLSKHDLLSRDALARLSGLSLRLLHHHAALVLEGNADRQQSVAALWECAEHWLQAGEVGRALLFLRSCARQAVEIGLPTEAAELLEKAVGLTGTTGERIEVLGELVYALQVASYWERVLAVLDDIVELKLKLLPDYSKHGDDELLRLEARWRCGANGSDLIEELTECIHCADASADHRVRAAVHGLALCDNLFRPQEAQSIFSSIASVLWSDAVTPLSRLRLLVIFHSSFGDHDLAVSAAKELIDAARTIGAPVTVVRALQYGAISFRNAGLVKECLSFGIEAFTLSERHSLGSALCSIANTLAWTYRDLGDMQAAVSWYRAAERWSSRISDKGMHAGVKATGALLAITDQRYTDAEHLLAQSSTMWTGADRPRWKIQLLAIALALRLRQNDYLPHEADLAELLSLFEIARAHDGHDFVALVLAQALEKMGNVLGGSALVREYIATRREKSQLSPELAALVKHYGSFA